MPEEPTSNIPKNVEIVVNEKCREYNYWNGSCSIYTNVATIRVGSSGTHYLKCKDDNGKITLHIVAPGWKSIDIIPTKDGWTF